MPNGDLTTGELHRRIKELNDNMKTNIMEQRQMNQLTQDNLKTMHETQIKHGVLLDRHLEWHKDKHSEMAAEKRQEKLIEKVKLAITGSGAAGLAIAVQQFFMK